MKTFIFILYIVISLFIAYLVYAANIVSSPFAYWAVGIISGYILGFVDKILIDRLFKEKINESPGS